MPTYDFEIISSPAFAAEMHSLLKQLGEASIVDITEAQEAPHTYVSMRITLTGSAKSATAGEQAGQSITASDSLPASGWNVSKPLNQIAYRISGQEKNL